MCADHCGADTPKLYYCSNYFSKHNYDCTLFLLLFHLFFDILLDARYTCECAHTCIRSVEGVDLCGPWRMSSFPERGRKRKVEPARCTCIEIYIAVFQQYSYHIPCCIYVSTIFNIHLTKPRHPNENCGLAMSFIPCIALIRCWCNFSDSNQPRRHRPTQAVRYRNNGMRTLGRAKVMTLRVWWIRSMTEIS